MKKIREILKLTFIYRVYKYLYGIYEIIYSALPIMIKKFFYHNIVFLVMTPVHGNLGDHAIAFSEKKILKEQNIKIFEIPGKIMLILEKKNLLKILDNSKIVVNGGGYLGTLWYHDEHVIRTLIDSVPKSKIFFFPNTMYYDDSEFGKQEFEKAKSYYKRDNIYKIYARDKYSYSKMLEISDRVGLAPDIAMSLKFDETIKNKSGCLLAMRKDCEKTIKETEYNILINDIQKIFGDNIKKIDTVVNYSIKQKKRKKNLYNFLEEIKKSELIVTDRLHGMIFAAISGTACIVVNSKSPKVFGCYEWIKNLDYVKICTNVNQFNEIYNSIPGGIHKYQNEEIVKNFDCLYSDIKNFIDS